MRWVLARGCVGDPLGGPINMRRLKVAMGAVVALSALSACNTSSPSNTQVAQATAEPRATPVAQSVPVAPAPTPSPPPGSTLPAPVAMQAITSAETVACEKFTVHNAIREDARAIAQWAEKFFSTPLDLAGRERLSGISLPFKDQGLRQTATYTHGFGNWEYVSLSLCPFVPSEVVVLDTTAGMKSATVIYRVVYRTSEAIHSMSEALPRSPQSYFSFSFGNFSIVQQRTAQFRYLDVGGWRLGAMTLPNGRIVTMTYN